MLTIHSIQLPNLKQVSGGFNMQSSGNFSCAPFKTDNDNNVIRGTYTCDAASNNVQTGTGTSTSSSSSSSSTSTKKSAASVSNANVVAVGAAAVFGWLALAL